MGKRFDKEFKIEAVRLASEPGNTQSEIERDLGISQGIISRWKRELRNDGDQAFPGKGRLKPDDDELRRLKRENERLRQERDILKKAVAIFSEDPNRYSGS
ncbi:transposase [Desulfosarcina widdelii]|uniref:Transposase n=1 Tax=Desulfosarcina widdelii TaxID=947919 RepID=A0A5K7Z535_9BACT|nr:transposase [Desulfosarcina widdelii]BBO74731.1 transposase [Desulfosarcina widdelii]BBO74923.1 transposase [Desulfosarcina widdelii]BBO76044.1 transposase [Desulfosarcina widdelii]BBO79090.1 transposase [Desulfosarcina widdelii]